MLRFVVSEQGQPELPGLDLDGRVVIGSGRDAHVRLPAAAAHAEHVVLDGGRWRAFADVVVDGVARRAGEDGIVDGRAQAATVAGGGGVPTVPDREATLVAFELGAYRVRVLRAPANATAAPPQRTESLARELMRSLLGDGASPTLTIERGPKAGSRRTLPPPESRLVIGRGDDADWSILDEDLSRKHAEVRRGWDGTTLRDLESQNGTRVDGERVIDVVELHDGARIELGNVVMTYTDPAERHLAGAVTPARPADKPVVTRAPSVAPFVIAVVIALLAAGALAYVLAS